MIIAQKRQKKAAKGGQPAIRSLTFILAAGFLASRLLPSFQAPDIPALPGMANVRIIRHFTKSERVRLELIQSIYRECVSAKELPAQLRLEKKKPVRQCLTHLKARIEAESIDRMLIHDNL